MQVEHDSVVALISIHLSHSRLFDTVDMVAALSATLAWITLPPLEYKELMFISHGHCLCTIHGPVLCTCLRNGPISIMFVNGIL